MSHFKNPFSDLVRREYDVTNLKKILDIFPTSLQVKQLTSTQLLERLRKLLEQRDIRIEELLAQLQDQNEAGAGLAEINAGIEELRNDLQIGDAITDAIEQTGQQTRINSLLQQGYIRIRRTPLFIKVDESIPTGQSENTTNEEFRILHENEEEGFLPSDLVSPSSISFVNISETEDVWFFKIEQWESNADGAPVPTTPTNAFKLRQFPEAHTTVYRIAPTKDSDIKTTMILGYNTKDEYRDAGLDIPPFNEATDYFGFMNVKAQVGTKDGIESTEAVTIGDMRLFRDKD